MWRGLGRSKSHQWVEGGSLVCAYVIYVLLSPKFMSHLLTYWVFSQNGWVALTDVTPTPSAESIDVDLWTWALERTNRLASCVPVSRNCRSFTGLANIMFSVFKSRKMKLASRKRHPPRVRDEAHTFGLESCTKGAHLRSCSKTGALGDWIFAWFYCHCRLVQIQQRR